MPSFNVLWVTLNQDIFMIPLENIEYIFLKNNGGNGVVLAKMKNGDTVTLKHAGYKKAIQWAKILTETMYSEAKITETFLLSSAIDNMVG